MPYSFDVTICCLHPQEDVPLRIMADAFAASLMLPVPMAIWDAAWIPLSLEWAERKDTAFIFWDMFETEIPVPDAEPIPAIATTAIEWWSALIEFLATDVADCTDGCEQTHYGYPS